MDFGKARERMVNEQIIARGITDKRVLSAMGKVPRHLFVHEGLRDRAYGDYPLPIGEGQTISQPYIVALMTQALDLIGNEKVLEIGTGSGYQTAVLAEIVEKVWSVERIPALAIRARTLVESLGYQHVSIKTADGTLGWMDAGPFDAILVTAGAPSVPDSLVRQLVIGGRLVIPVGGEVSQCLYRITRTETDSVKENLGGCVFVKLIGVHGWLANGV